MLVSKINVKGRLKVADAIPLGFHLLALALLVPASNAFAQNTAPGTPQAGATRPGAVSPLRTNPEIALREFEPQANQPYELGRGDEISIDVSGRPELNSKQTIGPDGKITIPLAGSIMLADRTREAAAVAVSEALAPFYSRVNVTIGVEKYTSNKVLLLGAVEHPGVETFDSPPTLLEVVTRGGASRSSGGSFGSGGSGTGGSAFNVNGDARPSGIGVPERVAIYRGSDKVIWVELKSLLDSGSPLADMRLKRDDIVYVPSASEQYVSMLGEVQHPGALQLESTSTLAKLIALSGGLTVMAGRFPEIQIIQPATGRTRTISFKQVLQPGTLDLTLHSGDIVYIPRDGLNRAAYVLEKISPLVTLFTASALITR